MRDGKTVLAKIADPAAGQGSNARYSFDENGEQWLIAKRIVREP